MMTVSSAITLHNVLLTPRPLSTAPPPPPLHTHTHTHSDTMTTITMHWRRCHPHKTTFYCLWVLGVKHGIGFHCWDFTIHQHNRTPNIPGSPIPVCSLVCTMYTCIYIYIHETKYFIFNLQIKYCNLYSNSMYICVTKLCSSFCFSSSWKKLSVSH